LNITVKRVEQITLIEISGEIDGKTAPQAQAQILPLLEPGCKMLLDMSGVDYMSSAGLRLMLSMHRQATANKGQLVLVGLSEEIKDTMAATGFLNFFAVGDTVEAGLVTLQ
jgi:anti-sigma B factor antagonist